jgi:hypothetical protein
VDDFFVAWKIAFDIETISLRLRQCSELRRQFLQLSANFFTIEAIVFLVETKILLPRRFSQRRNDLLRPDIDFSITEQLVGEAPTMFVTTNQIIYKENYHDSTNTNCGQVYKTNG